MREKKVRAWDKVTETYLFSDKFPSMWQFYKELENRGIRHFETEDYAGLKDKNGIEIYEGDILDFGDYYIFKHGRCLHIVYWNDEDVGFNSKEIGFQKLAGFGLDETGVVIGNIYENKDLLERGK